MIAQVGDAYDFHNVIRCYIKNNGGYRPPQIGTKTNKQKREEQLSAINSMLNKYGSSFRGTKGLSMNKAPKSNEELVDTIRAQSQGGVVLKGTVAEEIRRAERLKRFGSAMEQYQQERASQRHFAGRSQPPKPETPSKKFIDKEHRSQMWINMAKQKAADARESLTAPLTGVWERVTQQDGGGNDTIDIDIDNQPDMLERMDNLR